MRTDRQTNILSKIDYRPTKSNQILDIGSGRNPISAPPPDQLIVIIYYEIFSLALMIFDSAIRFFSSTICFIVHPKVEKILKSNWIKLSKFQLNNTTHYYFFVFFPRQKDIRYRISKNFDRAFCLEVDDNMEYWNKDSSKNCYPKYLNNFITLNSKNKIKYYKK